MNLFQEGRLSVVMDTDRSINRYRVGFSQMVVPFGVRWHGVIDSSVSVASLLPVFVVVGNMTRTLEDAEKEAFSSLA